MSARTDGFCAERRNVSSLNRRAPSVHYHTRHCLQERDEYIRELEAKLQLTYCAYCGHAVEMDDAAATGISEHIKTCPKHPMRELEARVKYLERLTAAGTEKAHLVWDGDHGKWKEDRR
jgi:hypothetical protein